MRRWTRELDHIDDGLEAVVGEHGKADEPFDRVETGLVGLWRGDVFLCFFFNRIGSGLDYVRQLECF